MTKEENEARLSKLKAIVSALPEKPGSYQYYDAEGTIIYVGKAKNLKNRVSSYFHSEVDRFKTKVLVSKIWDISYTVVNTEEDALLLENALIKKYNPRYNVLLKDGKTYPSICITKEYLPRIFSTRTINKKGGTYYGPYSHVGSMHAVLELIKKLYHPRTCRFPITKEGVEQKKYQVCLEYHIKNCGGPCIGKQTLEDYQKNIEQAREILKGNTRQVLRDMKEEMMQLAEELRFEEAEEIKRRYLLIESFVASSEVVSYTINNIDVRSMYNIGSVFRTADSFRVESVWLCGICQTPPSTEIHKTALGAEESVDWKYFPTALEAVEELKKQGYTVFSVEQVEHSTKLQTFVPQRGLKYAVVLGNEVKGVHQEVVDASDGCLEIPQLGTKHSMNVSVTAGIIIYKFAESLML